jgi:hypothetical protein
LSHQPSPTAPFAHLFGRPKPATVTANAAKPKPHVKSLASNAVMATKPRAKAEAAPAKKAAPKAAPAKAAERRAVDTSFAHLKPAEHIAEAEAAPAAAAAQALAAKIHAATAKSLTPTGTGAAKPKGMAAEILAAGRKRRGEI